MDPNANIIFGALVDDSMEGEIAITVIATGFPLGKTEGDEKLAFMQQQVHSSSKGSVRTVGEAVRASQFKEKQQREKEPFSQREKDRRMIIDVDMDEEDGESDSRSSRFQRIGSDDRRHKHGSTSSTSGNIASNKVRLQVINYF